MYTRVRGFFFLLHIGVSTNNIAGLWIVKYGLSLGWRLGYKCINVEVDRFSTCCKLTNHMQCIAHQIFLFWFVIVKLC